MGGRPLPALSVPSRARDDLASISAAALAAVSASSLLRRVLQGPAPPVPPGQPYALVAAGKASAAMLERWYALVPELPTRAIGVGTHDAHRVHRSVEWFTGGHPTPTAQSIAAADRALAVARELHRDQRLVVLLSGGASALLSAPVSGVTLEEKQAITRALMHDGRPIDELNCVRKHLSRIKGGRLAAACAGDTVTLAISDVVAPVEDDPSVIGSGPTVPDPTTFDDAWRIVSRIAAQDAVPPSIRQWLQRGCAGEVPDSPKPGDAAMSRSRYELIGTRHVAMHGAEIDATRLGYRVVVVRPPVLGEARAAGAAHVRDVLDSVGDLEGPLCVISSGETTVTVKGRGRGGRNQEFVAGAIDAVSHARRPMLLASLGSDGIDGPTDAAGAWVAPEIAQAARTQSLDVAAYLANNDAYALHHKLGTLIRTGPTDTNVGDLQVALVY